MGKSIFKKPPFALDRSRYGDLVEQIASSLRRAIETGYYKAGEILPPGRDLAVLLGVSKGVAEQALAIIREEGLTSPRPRIGSVVCAKDQPLWKGHVVIVVPPGIGNPCDNVVYSIVRDALIANGYLPLVATVPRSSTGLYDDFALLDTQLRQHFDLVVQLLGEPEVTRHLARCKIPLIRLAVDDDRPPNCVGIVRRRDDLAMPGFIAHCREANVRRVMQVTAMRTGRTSCLR